MPIIIPADNTQRSTTLIDLIQNVCLELGISAPQAAITSPDPQILQLMAIARRLGKDLVREFEWEALVRQAVINTQPGAWNYPLPLDWNRQVEQTEWSANNHRPMNGPVTAQRWASYQAWNATNTLRMPFRIIDGSIRLLSAPESPETFSYEYITENWVIPESGPAQNTFLSDTDSCVFDDALMQEGIKLRWRKAKGLAYEERDYLDVLALCKAQNKGAPEICLASRRHGRLIDHYNVPETGYGPR